MDNNSEEAVVVQWNKLGLIFRPDPTKWWMKTHAALPVPLIMEGGLCRVFFSSRDGKNRSHVGFFEINLKNPEVLLRVSAEPVLSPGPWGYFDDQGVYAASAVKCGGNVYLYTIGWNSGVRPPLFYASIGLAISSDAGETFTKYGKSPIMARSDYDPCLVTSPVVIKEGTDWRMWYVSGYHWEDTGSSFQSHYHIKYAESDDGIVWRREGVVCLDHIHPGEKNIARACVYRRRDMYHAWYSYSCGEGYRIGYAVSIDGISWTRMDNEAGIDVSASGWDSEAQAYPWVVQYADRLYMFYNGNNYGKDGIGLAVSEVG